MRLFRIALLCLSFMLPGSYAQQPTSVNSWLVLVSTQSDVNSLTQKQVMSLFLGRKRYLPDGDKVKAIDHPHDSAMRAGFYQALTGKSIADIDAYWARLKYSGRASPPLTVENAEQILQLLREESGIIAYLPSTYLELLQENGITPVLTI